MTLRGSFESHIYVKSSRNVKLAYDTLGKNLNMIKLYSLVLINH